MGVLTMARSAAHLVKLGKRDGVTAELVKLAMLMDGGTVNHHFKVQGISTSYLAGKNEKGENEFVRSNLGVISLEMRAKASEIGLQSIAIPRRERKGQPRAYFFIHDLNKLVGNSDHETLNYGRQLNILRKQAGLPDLHWQNERAARGSSSHYANAGNVLDVCTLPPDCEGGAKFMLDALKGKAKKYGDAGANHLHDCILGPPLSVHIFLLFLTLRSAPVVTHRGDQRSDGTGAGRGDALGAHLGVCTVSGARKSHDPV